jgi:hypothetical protein
MLTSETASDRDVPSRVGLAPGIVLVGPAGQVRILRSRTADDSGWNCSDGAAIDDRTANDPSSWTPYTPEELAADLRLAREVNAIAGHRIMSGGLASWDACSGRPCQLPRIARLVD